MRKSEVALSLALITSSGISLWLWQELRAARALQARLGSDSQAVSVEPAETHEPVTNALAAPPPATLATVATTPEPAVAAREPRRKSGPSEDEALIAQRRMLQDPRFRAAWRDQARLNYGLRRENIIRVIGLTPEQADAVIDLQIDRELAWTEDPRALNEDFQANERAHQAKLTELLGQEKSARLQEYMESRGSRMQVDQFRNLLGGPDTLREDQVEPLIAALHTENAQLKRELRESERTAMWSSDTAEAWRQHAERRAELEKEAHARMHAAAAPILSRSQLEKFDAMLERDRERRAAEQRMQGLQSKLGQDAAPAD